MWRAGRRRLRGPCAGCSRRSGAGIVVTVGGWVAGGVAGGVGVGCGGVGGAGVGRAVRVKVSGVWSEVSCGTWWRCISEKCCSKVSLAMA